MKVIESGTIGKRKYEELLSGGSSLSLSLSLSQLDSRRIRNFKANRNP